MQWIVKGSCRTDLSCVVSVKEVSVLPLSFTKYSSSPSLSKVSDAVPRSNAGHS